MATMIAMPAVAGFNAAVAVDTLTKSGRRS
jgi:hypothetical protein